MITIAVFATTDESAPPQHRFIAHYFSGAEILPVRVSGATEAEARAAAEHLLNTERARLQTKPAERTGATPERLAALEKARATRAMRKAAEAAAAGEGAAPVDEEEL